MDAKLKALKVVDLKDLLSKAGEQIPAKANKPDLIAKILGSSSAQSKYNELYGGGIPVVSPAAPVSAPIVQPLAAAPAAKAAPIPVSTPAASTPALEKQPAIPEPTPAAQPVSVPLDEDGETAKRRARAERFGIIFEEKPAPTQKKLKAAGAATNGAGQKKTAGGLADDAEKLKARAARFGFDASNQNAGSKRTAPAEEVDPEEAERRRKRAERFRGNV